MNLVGWLFPWEEIAPYVEALKPPGTLFPLIIFSKSIHLHYETEVNNLIKLPV